MFRGKWFLIPLLLAVSCLTFLPAASSRAQSLKDNPVQSDYEEAMRLKQAGRLHEAESKLKSALDLEPANVNYRFELANILALRYDTLSESAKKESGFDLLKQAARELEQVIMYQPDFIAARFNLGVVYKRQGLYEKSREAFREVFEQDPKQVSALLQVAATYEEQGFLDEAKAVYEQAKELAYTDPDIQAALDDLNEQRRQPEQQSLEDIFSRQSMGGNFPYTQGSHAENFYQNGMTGGTANQSIQQALPYLGSWLMQQFMKVRHGDGES